MACGIFFNQSEEVVNYLLIKSPHFNYKQLPKEAIVGSRIVQNSSKKIPDCTRQHLMVFMPNDPVFCREYLCSCDLCLQFKSTECLEKNTPLYSDIPYEDDFGDFVDNDDNEVDGTEQIFNFVDVLSFVSLFSSSPNEPLYFVKVTEKGTASENHSDLYGHFVSTSENLFKWILFKIDSIKKCQQKEITFAKQSSAFSR